MTEAKETKRPSSPPQTVPAGPPEPDGRTTPEDVESRKASRNFLIWWIGLPLLVMLLVVLLRDRA